jgi:WD40 repeat protein
MRKFLAILFLLNSLVSHAQPPASPILFKLQGHSDDLECLAVSGNGAYLASGSWDGMVNIFTVDSFYTPLTTLTDHFSAANCISITFDGKFIATGGNDGKVFTYYMDSSGMLVRDKNIPLHRMSINAIYLDRTGKFVYTGSNDGTISFYNIAKQKDQRINNTNPVNSIAVANDRRTIFCSDNTSIIKKYEVTGKLVESFEGHTDQVNCVILSKDNKFLYSASSDKTIKVWNVQNGKLEKTLTGHDWKVTTLGISNNGKFLVSGSNDGSTKVWDLETAKELKSFDNIGTKVKGVAISNDNTRLFVAMDYPLDSFETRGVLVLKSGIEIQKKENPKLPAKAPLPKGYTPKNTGTPGTEKGKPKTPDKNEGETNKQIIKKNSEIEISEEKKKTAEPKKDANRED